jgi:hypothetical protein
MLPPLAQYLVWSVFKQACLHRGTNIHRPRFLGLVSHKHAGLGCLRTASYAINALKTDIWKRESFASYLALSY